MLKSLLKLGLLGTLAFLGLSIYFYKTSGNFRKSIIAAFAAATFSFSSVKPAHAAGQADAFTTQQQYQSRLQQRGSRLRPDFFSGRSSNNGSEPEKPDDFGSDSDSDGLPKIPRTESVEKTEKRVERIDDYLRQMDEVSDSETESESEIEDECHPSMDAMSHSLNPEFSKYQEDYYPKSSPKRFDTNQHPPSKFDQLAYDPVRKNHTRTSFS